MIMNIEQQISKIEGSAHRAIPVTIAYSDLGKVSGIYFYQPDKAALIVCTNSFEAHQQRVIGDLFSKVHLKLDPRQPRLAISVSGDIYDDIPAGLEAAHRLELIDIYRAEQPESQKLTCSQWQKAFIAWRAAREAVLV